MINRLYDIFAHWVKTDGVNPNNVWLYSDPHFADPEMVYLRKNYIGDDEQIKRINSKVGKKDTIIILGDIGDVSWVKKIRGYKVLIMGNHDAGASNYKRIKDDAVQIFDPLKDTISENTLAMMDESMANLKKRIVSDPIDVAQFQYQYVIPEDNHLFDEVYEGPLMINDRLILSHEPMDLPPYLYNIHGHDHADWYQNQPDQHLNVCAEHINYSPISLTNLLKTGILKEIPTIHRVIIDGAIAKHRRINE